MGRRSLLDDLWLPANSFGFFYFSLKWDLTLQGRIAMLGFLEEDILIDWKRVIFSDLTIKGSYGQEMYKTWYKTTVIIQGGLDIRSVITHHYHYSEYENGIETFQLGQCGKISFNGPMEHNPQAPGIRNMSQSQA